MKAFITGASGFVGTHLAQHLLAEGDQVLGCSLTGRWHPPAPGDLVQDVELCVWDVRRPPSRELRRRLEAFGPDCIYHLAALADPGQCGERQPLPAAVAINVGGTENVVELALELATGPRLLLASSCHVYAPVGENQPVVAEDYPCRPTSGYGQTKLAAEEVLRRATAERDLAGLVARGFHHAGPRQSARYLISQWCRALAGGENPLKVKNRDTWLDLTDVRDTARAYRLLMERGRPGDSYNVGCGVGRRSGDLLEMLLRLHGRPVAIEETSPGRHQEPIANCGALAAACGWRPRYDPQTTLRDTLEYWWEIPAT